LNTIYRLLAEILLKQHKVKPPKTFLCKILTQNE
jgi:hypothetical protein